MTKNRLLILTALKAEATPFIRHYNLRKKDIIESKPLYYSGTVTLLITGVGKTNVKNTLQNYYNRHKIKQHDFIVNIGVAGGNADLGKIGDLFFINKIICETDGPAYYPKALFKHGINEASLTTVKNPIVDRNETYDGLVDMESLDIWNILKSKISNDRFIFLKVISDYMDNKCLNIKSFEKKATKILTYQLNPITNLLNILQEIEIKDHSALNKNEK